MSRKEALVYGAGMSGMVPAVPLARPDNYRLFRDGLIMCGTMSGAIDPFMGFGTPGFGHANIYKK